MRLATSKNLTILGILTILAAVVNAALAVVRKEPVNLEVTLAAISTGIGFILAKGQANTGGTIPSTPEAVKRVTDAQPAKKADLPSAPTVVLVVLAIGAALLFAAPARAQESVPSKFGGCSGNFCFSPSATISVMAINLSRSTVEAGFVPGVGYGVAWNQGRWSSVGADAYVQLQAAPNQIASATLMLKFFNGYGRIGLSKDFIGSHDWKIPIGIGADF